MARHTTLTRTGMVAAPAASIVALVSTTDGFTAINPHLTADPKLEITPFGPGGGVGSGFRFRGKDGKGTQTVAAVTDERVAFDIDMGAMGRSVQEIAVRRVDDANSEVTWTMQMDAGLNPILRVFGLFADKVIGPSLDTGVRNLAGHPWHP